MNLQRGDKGIGWTDATWNPVSGCKSTKEQCAVRDVCYARRISERFGRSFEPTLHPERLEEPYKLKKPSRIFVCSMGELFGPWVPWGWILPVVMRVVKDNRRHTFQFLTKFPEGYRSMEGWPENVWLGATVNRQHEVARIDPLVDIKRNETNHATVFVSAEPLLGPIYTSLAHIDWLIIGAQTNPCLQPAQEWVEALLRQADFWGIPVFMKKELKYEPKRREFPNQK